MINRLRHVGSKAPGSVEARYNQTLVEVGFDVNELLPARVLHVTLV